MSGLASTDLLKLAKVLGLLGSPYDGERAAAGLLASRMLQSAGLTWEQFVLGRPTVEAISAPASSPESFWRSDLALCQRHISFLREWERGFIASVGARSSLTPKQRLTLNGIAQALRARGKA